MVVGERFIRGLRIDSVKIYAEYQTLYNMAGRGGTVSQFLHSRWWIQGNCRGICSAYVILGPNVADCSMLWPRIGGSRRASCCADQRLFRKWKRGTEPFCRWRKIACNRRCLYQFQVCFAVESCTQKDLSRTTRFRTWIWATAHFHGGSRVCCYIDLDVFSYVGKRSRRKWISVYRLSLMNDSLVSLTCDVSYSSQWMLINLNESFLWKSFILRSVLLRYSQSLWETI